MPQMYGTYGGEILIMDERAQAYVYTFKASLDRACCPLSPALRNRAYSGQRIGNEHVPGVAQPNVVPGSTGRPWLETPSSLHFTFVKWIIQQTGKLFVNISRFKIYVPLSCHMLFAHDMAQVLYVVGHPGAAEEGDLMDDVLYVKVRQLMLSLLSTLLLLLLLPSVLSFFRA